MNNTQKSQCVLEVTDTELKHHDLNFFVQYISSPKLYTHPHIHPAIELLFIVRGQYHIFCNDIHYMAYAGDTVLFRSNMVHRIYPTESNCVYYVLKINPDFILNMSFPENVKYYLLQLSLCDKNAKVIWSKYECEQNGLYHAWGQLLQNKLTQEPIYDITLKTASANILLSILRDIVTVQTPIIPESQQTIINKIYDAVEYINNHYYEDITSENYSKSIFMSNGHFSRKFKEVTGINFKHYLLMTRIDRAEKELLCTDKSVTKIAMDCGFNNMSYFSAMYKKQKHVTPTEARLNSNQKKIADGRI